MNYCPTCGHEISEMSGVKLDYDNNILLVNGTAITLQARQADLLKVLFDAHPKALSTQEIMSRIYGAGGGPDGARNFISVLLCNLRPKLRGTGLRVITLPQRGYRVDLHRIGAAA